MRKLLFIISMLAAAPCFCQVQGVLPYNPNFGGCTYPGVSGGAAAIICAGSNATTTYGTGPGQSIYYQVGSPTAQIPVYYGLLGLRQAVIGSNLFYDATNWMQPVNGQISTTAYGPTALRMNSLAVGTGPVVQTGFDFVECPWLATAGVVSGVDAGCVGAVMFPGVDNSSNPIHHFLLNTQTPVYSGSGGELVFEVNPGVTIDPNASTQLNAKYPTDKPLVVQATGGQTASLQEWQNSTGGLMASAQSNGTGAFGIGTSTPWAWNATNATGNGTNFQVYGSGASRLIIDSLGTASSTPEFHFINEGAPANSRNMRFSNTITGHMQIDACSDSYGTCAVGLDISPVTGAANLLNTTVSNLTDSALTFTHYAVAGTGGLLSNGSLLDTGTNIQSPEPIIAGSGEFVTLGGFAGSLSQELSVFASGGTGTITSSGATNAALGNLVLSGYQVTGSVTDNYLVLSPASASFNHPVLTPSVTSTLNSSEPVSFSSTPTFSLTTRQSVITLTGNITSFTLGVGADGQEKTLCFVQGSGPYTVTPPSNVHGFFTIGTTNGKYNCQHFDYIATPAIWVADSTGVINQ